MVLWSLSTLPFEVGCLTGFLIILIPNSLQAVMNLPLNSLPLSTRTALIGNGAIETKFF